MLDSQPRPHSLNLQGPRSGSEELLSDIAKKSQGVISIERQGARDSMCLEEYLMTS